jgi:hypothetical protein
MGTARDIRTLLRCFHSSFIEKLASSEQLHGNPAEANGRK